MATDKSLRLQQVLETHRMAHIEKLLDKYKEKRQEAKEALEENYKDKIYNPINSGSYAKSTHINTKFDLDIVALSKRNHLIQFLICMMKFMISFTKNIRI